MTLADRDRDMAAAPASSGRPTPPAWRSWLPPWLGVPLLIYAGTRVGQLLVIAWMNPPGTAADATAARGVVSLRDRLLAWDGGWYVRVADPHEGYPTGYTYNEAGELVANGLAFFPGYPMLVRLLHRASGLDLGDAALVVAWCAAAAAAVAVYALGTRLHGARAGAVLCVLFCAQPMSVVLSMAYSEGLFVALAAAALLAAYRGYWLVAGALGLAAGLTRPTAVALAAALVVAAGIEIRRGGWRWRPVAGATLGLAGVPAYLAWVGLRVGDWGAWFAIQTAGWGSTFDGGVTTMGFVGDALRAGEGWVQVSVALLLLVAVAAAVAAVVTRVWPPLVVYGLVAAVLVLGQGGYYHSKPRLLVPVLVLLVPPAVALARARLRTAVPVLVGYSFFGFWYGAHLLTVWRYAI